MEELLVNVYAGGIEWEHAMIEDVKEDSVVLSNGKERRLEIEWDAITAITW